MTKTETNRIKEAIRNIETSKKMLPAMSIEARNYINVGLGTLKELIATTTLGQR